jgi:hypothetical protein
LNASPMTAFLAVAFFADYLDAFKPLGLVIKLCVTLIFLACYLPSAVQTRRFSAGAALVAAGYVVYCLTRFTSLPSSTYELAKLALALVMVLGCINTSLASPDPRLAPVRLEGALRRALKIALKVNALAVTVQVLLGNRLLVLVGVPEDFFTAPEKIGRYSGLILNLPLWSSMLFVRILLADRKLFRADAWQLTRMQQLGLYGMLVLSGQKYVLICAALHLLVQLPMPKRLLLVGAILSALPLLNTTDNYQIVDRVTQAQNIAEEGVYTLAEDANASADYPQFPFLDLRINSWFYAWAHLRDMPEGRGLGTWGDFSASLNPKIRNPVTLSESQWAHLIVEQGYGAFVLILLASTPFLFAHRALRRNLLWLGMFIFIAGWFTMGASDYLWFFATFALMFNLGAVHRAALPRRLPMQSILL